MRQASKFWTEHTRSDKTARERAFGALISLSITKRLKRFKKNYFRIKCFLDGIYWKV